VAAQRAPAAGHRTPGGPRQHTSGHAAHGPTRGGTGGNPPRFGTRPASIRREHTEAGRPPFTVPTYSIGGPRNARNPLFTGLFALLRLRPGEPNFSNTQTETGRLRGPPFRLRTTVRTTIPPRRHSLGVRGGIRLYLGSLSHPGTKIPPAHTGGPSRLVLVRLCGQHSLAHLDEIVDNGVGNTRRMASIERQECFVASKKLIRFRDVGSSTSQGVF